MPIKDYKSGYSDGANADEGQRKTTIGGGSPKSSGSSIDDYKQGFFDGASADVGQRTVNQVQKMNSSTTAPQSHPDPKVPPSKIVGK